MSDVTEKIKKAKTQLQIRNTFFGRLILGLDFEENKDISTMSINYDGHCIYNKDFVLNMSDKQLIGVMAHELLHCFDGNAVVGSDDILIKDIKINDKVICNDGKEYSVTNIDKRKYNGNMFKFKIKGGLGFNVTPNHRFLVIKNKGWKTKLFDESKSWRTKGNRYNERVLTKPQWVTSQKIKEGDYLLIPKIKGISKYDNYKIDLTKYIKGNKWSVKNKTIKLNKDFAYFLGRFTADGYTDKNIKSNVIGIVFHPKKKQQAIRCQKILKNIGYTSRLIFQKNDGIGIYRLLFCSQVLKRLIRDIVGTYSHNKTIPSFILYNNNLNILKEYISGLYDGDGYLSYRNSEREIINYCSVSRVLILRLQKALNRLNMMGNVYERKNYGDLIIFDKLFSKEENLKQQYILSCGDKELFKLRKIKHNKKRQTKHYLDLDDYFGLKIKDIETYKHKGYVYNISTDKENYLVNNMITHNCALLHHFRFAGKIHELANISEDICINSMLIKDGYELPMVEIKDDKGNVVEKVNGLIPNSDDEIELDFGICKITIKQCSEKNAEMIYEEIIKEIRKYTKDISLSSEGLDSLNGKDGKVLAQGIKEVAKRLLDEHSKIDKKLSKKERVKAQKQVEGIIREAMECSKMRGDTPSGLDRMWGSIHEEKFNWKTLLQRYITELLPYDQSWRNFGKKTYGTGIYSPMTVREQIDVTVAIDVSGSIEEKDLTDFMSEIVGVANQFKNRIKMTIIIHESEVVDTFSVFNSEDVKNLKIKGCGGTSFEPVIEHIKKDNQKTKCLVWLTDGYGEKKLERQPFEIIWVLTSDGSDELCKDSGRILWLKDTQPK